MNLNFFGGNVAESGKILLAGQINQGEIWIYVPRGSKKITLKHPRWGVLLDYAFPKKLDSHMSYELRIECPEEAHTVAGETSTGNLT